MGMMKSIMIDKIEAARLSNPQDYYYCRNCKIDFPVKDATENIEFPGSLEEPAEISHQCPDCGSDDLREEMVAWCRSCGDIQVSDQGEQCSECNTCEREACFDAMMNR